MRQRERVLQLPTLGFLLAVVFLPITTNLYGTFGTTRTVALIYSANLALIALLQLLLRLCVLHGERSRLHFRLRPIAASLYTSAVFVLSVFFGFVDPKISEVLWYAAFGGPVVARLTQEGPPPGASTGPALKM